MYSFYNSIFEVPEYPMVCDLKNHINVKASNSQKQLFPGLYGFWGFCLVGIFGFLLVWNRRLRWALNVTQDGYFYFLQNGLLKNFRDWRLCWQSSNDCIEIIIQENTQVSTSSTH